MKSWSDEGSVGIETFTSTIIAFDSHYTEEGRIEVKLTLREELDSPVSRGEVVLTLYVPMAYKDKVK